MKKLMIVAAVATMAGALVAADGYDFTASVKTTKGKAGSQKTTYTVNLGHDGTQYWWDAMGFTDANAGKRYINSLKNDEKADYAWNELGFDGVNTDWPLKEVYKGKERWCTTFKFSETAYDCYRVAGSQKLKGVVTIDACCNGTWEFFSAEGYLADSLAQGGVEDEISTALLYRFGGITPTKATKVEYVGSIGNFGDIGSFALAGQGAWDTKNDIIKNISGNIVGVLQNSDCEYCCDYNVPAIVFECSTDDELISVYQDTPDGTAAFGTFSLKYNKNY